MPARWAYGNHLAQLRSIAATTTRIAGPIAAARRETGVGVESVRRRARQEVEVQGRAGEPVALPRGDDGETAYVWTLELPGDIEEAGAYDGRLLVRAHERGSHVLVATLSQPSSPTPGTVLEIRLSVAWTTIDSPPRFKFGWPNCLRPRLAPGYGLDALGVAPAGSPHEINDLRESDPTTMPPTPDVANGIAQQMRDSRQSQTWRKVTTILSAYDAYRLTEGLRERIDRDFAAAGLKLTPQVQEVTRDGRLRISMGGAEASSSNPANGGSMPRCVTLWTRRDTGWERIPSVSAASNVVIVDIDLSLGDHDGLIQSLPDCLTGLDAGVVTDLLEPDRHAEFKVAKPGAATSRASLLVARVEEGESVLPDKAVQLSMGLVEFAVGDTWLITARHPPSTYLSGSPADSGQGVPGALRYFDSLMEYGLADATTSAEAALTVINHGVDSFSRARDVLASYLESWRTDFARGSRDKSLLSDLQATLPLVVSALEPLRKPTVVRWTAGRLDVEAKDLSDQIARNYEALQDLQGTVSAAIGQADQAKNEEYQRSLATLASVLLAPALVASVFGANDMLEDSPFDLVWLLIAMIVAGGLTQLFIRRRFGPRSRKPAPS